MTPVSNKILKLLRQFSIVTSVIVGGCLITWSFVYLNHDWNDQISEDFKSAIRITGILWLIPGIFAAIVKSSKFTNVFISLSAVNFLYLVLELGTYLLITINLVSPRLAIEDSSFGVFNRECARFDSISGYKWLPVDCRITKIVNGEVVFDNRFTSNGQGYLSKQDYMFRKQDSTITRYLVFGDSFTAGMYLERSWPDYLQNKLDREFAGQKFEIYSFAIDGAGLFNWHRIFMNEIIPYYEFDGIIIAAWGNDFSRDFAIMHHEGDGAYFGYFDKAPDNYRDFYDNFFPKTWFVEIVPDSVIDQKIARTSGSEQGIFQFTIPDLNFMMKLYDAMAYISYQRKQEGFEEKFISSRQDFMKEYRIENFKERYGLERFGKLDTMIKYCKAHHKQVILCTQADEVGIRDLKTGNYHWMQGELEGLAKHYDVHYFDGLRYFLELSEEEIGESFLKYDPHWSQKGSDIFAENFYRYFIELHNK